MRVGKLISIEGLDSCGKSTQVMELEVKLRDMGIPVMRLREPGGCEVSEQIRSLLLAHRDEEESIGDTTELLLFMASRVQLMDRVVRPYLRSGINVIMDRFIDSTWVYQGYTNDNLDLVNKTIALYLSDMVPDGTIYLNAPIEFTLKGLGDKEKDRIESKGIEYYQKVKEGFDYLCYKESKRIKVVEVTENNQFRNKDEIASEILAIALNIINRK